MTESEKEEGKKTLLDIDPIIYDLFEFRPRKGDLKKLEIIKATIDCLAHEGLENTTYEAIAQKIGTRRAHVAYHFSDKHYIYQAAVKYILATNQQISINHMSEATDGKDMLKRYVEGPFIWAQTHPEQLSVMLLLYYLCVTREEYHDLHYQIRKGGHERIKYILSSKLGKKFTEEEVVIYSKSIQNMISGAIIDAVTTRKKTLEEAKQETIKSMNRMIFCE